MGLRDEILKSIQARTMAEAARTEETRQQIMSSYESDIQATIVAMTKDLYESMKKFHVYEEYQTQTGFFIKSTRVIPRKHIRGYCNMNITSYAQYREGINYGKRRGTWGEMEYHLTADSEAALRIFRGVIENLKKEHVYNFGEYRIWRGIEKDYCIDIDPDWEKTGKTEKYYDTSYVDTDRIRFCMILFL